MVEIDNLQTIVWHKIYRIADTGKKFRTANNRKRFYKRYLGFDSPAYCKNTKRLEKCIEKLDEIKKELENE